MPAFMHVTALLLFFGIYSTFFNSSINAQESLLIEVNAHDFCTLEKFAEFPSRLYVGSVSYSTDCNFEQTEFDTYTQPIHDCWAEKATLAEVCECLQQKKKFKKIIIKATCIDEKWHIHFDCISEWTFCRLDIKGFMTGRDRYRQYYSLFAGEQFLVDKHRDSIERIYRILEQEGYFAAKIIDTCAYDTDTKQVTVQLYIVRGSPARIKSVDLEINGVSVRMTNNQAAKKMIKLLQNQLSMAVYKTDVVNNAARVLRCYLLKKGFFHVDLSLEAEIVQGGKSVRLKFLLKGNKEKALQFFGNHAVKTDALIEYIQEFGPYVHSVPPTLMAQELIREYERRGYWDAQVAARLEKSRHYFLIDEGEQAYIEYASFDGLKALSEKDAIKLLGFICKKNCDDRLIQIGIRRFKEWYEQNGYWDCSVAHSFKKSINGRYYIELIINEGKKRIIKDCLVSNNPLLTKELQRVFLNEYSGLPCNNSFLAAQRLWLQKKLASQGFIQAQLYPYFHESEEGIFVEWHLTHDAQPLLFGKTIF